MQQVTAQISGNPCLFKSGRDFLFRLSAECQLKGALAISVLCSDDEMK